MLSENFTYDNFNRLTTINTNGTTYRMAYDRYGRMESKSQHDFSFDNARFSADHPHAVSRVQAHRQPPFAGHTVTYTPFDKVKTVTMGSDNLLIEYGYDRQRIRMTESVGGHERVKTYIGNCEFIHSDQGLDHSLTYLSSPDGIFAVAESTSNGYRLHYVHTDNLGSWDIITDMGGDLEQSLSFDAWGNRRDASTWSGNMGRTPKFDRGFTGHEHLLDFGLINMNGRMYDPLLSSFLSPDNYMQDPTTQQGFNRYAYCMYNPLKYIDPTGERQMGWSPSTYYYEQMARLVVLKEQYRVYEVAMASHWLLMDYISNCVFSQGPNAMGSSGSGNHGSGGGGGNNPNEPADNDQGNGNPTNTTNSNWISGTSSDNPASANKLDYRCYWHYMFGGREDLYVDASTINTSRWSFSNLIERKDGNYIINLFSDSFIVTDSQIAFALGQIILKPLGNDMYEIQDDRYNFDLDGNGFSWRNIATFWGGLVHGVIDDHPIRITPAVFFGGPFNIIFINREIYIKP